MVQQDQVASAVLRRELSRELYELLGAIADPERSDVKSGETRSELSPTLHGTTRVKYVTDVVPDFWVPAIGGRHMLLKLLESEPSDLIMNVEKRAQQAAQPATP